MRAIGRFIGAIIRLVLLPFKLLFLGGVAAAKLVLRVSLLPLKACMATTRLMGFRGILLGVVGLVVGLLLAPMSGRQLREKLLASLAGGAAVPDDELADKVTFELSHAPRTWHLEPQPEVSVLAGRVVLRGEVRTEDDREEFGRVASAIPGVVAVDNQLVVADADAGGESGGDVDAGAETTAEPAAE